MKPIISIIYVYFNTPVEITNALNSIKGAVGKLPYEIIIVDNASLNPIPQKFCVNENIKIIKNDVNEGYGKALNCGVEISKGEYLVLINSDTEFTKNSVKSMFNRMEKNLAIGVMGPRVVDKNMNNLESFNKMPFIPRAIFNFSFLGGIFPFNQILDDYHLRKLDRNLEHEVDVTGGVCLMIRKKVFETVKGFDENFFMYFEEDDFCFRVRKAGYKVIYFPESKIIHLVSRSMLDKQTIRKRFEQSRFKFFNKYHGFLNALMAEAFLRFFTKSNLLLFFILLLSGFLNFFRINELMFFIGDQGWFYLSARDMVLTGKIPLVGITASHTWLHQGPLWTYILAIILWIFKFNPVAPAYFTGLLGVVTVYTLYKVSKEMFSENVAILVSVLYASSPLVVLSARMPYHTSPIPFFTILAVYFFYKWTSGKIIYFPFVIFSLAVLYNFELATAVLWLPLLLILMYGIWKKKIWVIGLFKKRIILLSLSGFIVPMFPILVYDFFHGFPQTIKFMVWIIYRILVSLGLFHGQASTDNNYNITVNYFIDNFSYLIFPLNKIISSTVLFSALVWLLILTLKKQINYKKMFFLVLFLTVAIGFFINNTPSQAYFPIFFPIVVVIIALFVNEAMKNKTLFFPVLFFILIVISANSSFLILKNYSTQNGYSYNDRLKIARKIVNSVGNKRYNLIGQGRGSEFESLTMNYEYLLWWLDNPPSKQEQQLKIVLEEGDNITIKIYEQKDR